MMNKAVEKGKFRGYKINDNLHFSLLQFADDTIISGGGSWENIWTIKSLLRGFELVSRLKINFVKSKLYGINIDNSLLNAGAAFLSCKTASVPFKFLGIPVGANPRRRETWNPILEALTKRLNSWTGHHLSYGGRVTLINSVLSSMPLYFFSFFKAPRCVIKDIEKIQRTFLWGGSLDEKKINWVKWDHVCLPKKNGGLGVKNLELFNIALLSKWRWRFLNHDNAIWNDLLRHRYGHLPSSLLGKHDLISGGISSLWWRDVISSGNICNVDWFKSNIGCRVGNGNDIEFWHFKWYDNQVLCDLYPDLYVLEAYKYAKVAERIDGSCSVPRCKWDWLQPLDEIGTQRLAELEVLLADFSYQSTDPDHWRWIPEGDDIFSVKSSYACLLSSQQVEPLDTHVLDALQRVWRTDVPSKINFFRVEVNFK
ncbi:hypothetical protein TSUD_78280 [Trifolium subterraneum]|uniref:Reverse transcriptase domain-containing protein n=1 Tax=Trifolium subterraneum TaxID=3900 RepID=A0A2Z6MC38_TRISU|nr:hypothetical protein TSUD_78280 [Trifolium subterraneum]